LASSQNSSYKKHVYTLSFTETPNSQEKFAHRETLYAKTPESGTILYAKIQNTETFLYATFPKPKNELFFFVVIKNRVFRIFALQN
jgi:hypothetical protein